MKFYLKIINIILLVLLLSPSLVYGDWRDHDIRFQCGVVYDIPYDYRIDDVPGENYIIINMKAPLPDYRWVIRAEEELNLKIAKISLHEGNTRVLKLSSLISDKIKPLLASEGMKLKDDILIIPDHHFEPPLLMVGVYNPTPRKICILKEILDSFRNEEYYNYKYIFYRMLTPLSMDDKIQEIFKSLPWDDLEAKARSIFGVSDEEAWELGVHVFNKTWIVVGGEGITGGMEIDILVPNPPKDKVHEWVVEVRKYIPEDMPVMFAFTERKYIVGEPEIGTTPIINKNVSETPAEEDVNEKYGGNSQLFYSLAIIIAGLIVISTFIITRYIRRSISI